MKVILKKRIGLTVGPEYFDFVRQQETHEPVKLQQEIRGEKVRCTGQVSYEIKSMLAQAAKRAKDRGHDFNLTGEFLLGLLERQDFCCAISTISFDLSKRPDYSRRPFTMSIDRMNTKCGYTNANVRLVCTVVNIARSGGSDESSLRMCQAVFEAQVFHARSQITKNGTRTL